MAININADQRAAMLERYGMGSYEPSVSAFFPSIRRGHGSKGPSYCNAQGCRGGGEHFNKTANIDEWLEQVGAKIPDFNETYGYVA